jgi:hypothetical protein
MVDRFRGTTEQVHLSAAGWSRGPIFDAKRPRFQQAGRAFAMELRLGHENSPSNSTPAPLEISHRRNIAPQYDRICSILLTGEDAALRYSQIMRNEPRNVDAVFLLALVMTQQRQFAEESAASSPYARLHNCSMKRQFTDV